MSRGVIYEKFGGPEVLEVRDVPEPHAGPNEVRIRVTAAGLNPVDWILSSMPEAAKQFGVNLPSGFGSDLAGIVDEVGEGVTSFALGEHVYGGSLGRAVADFILIKIPVEGRDLLWHTPKGISDEIASTLSVAGRTASAAIAAIGGLKSGDTVLIGGAAGGVGVFAVQLAKIAGAKVIGTASESTFEFLRQFGVEPVEYGPGLADRVKALAPQGLTAAIDLYGTEAAEAAIQLGVSRDRISTIAAGPNAPLGVHAVGGRDASSDALEKITNEILAGHITVPIAAKFPIEKIREAVTLQSDRHVHGKVIITF